MDWVDHRWVTSLPRIALYSEREATQFFSDLRNIYVPKMYFWKALNYKNTLLYFHNVWNSQHLHL